MLKTAIIKMEPINYVVSMSRLLYLGARTFRFFYFIPFQANFE